MTMMKKSRKSKSLPDKQSNFLLNVQKMHFSHSDKPIKYYNLDVKNHDK
jgi:hypothetical protein